MGMNIGGKGGVRSEINVTPLVDIVLVLLIVFIVIAPAVDNGVALPVAKHSEKVPPDASEGCLTLIFSARNGQPGAIGVEGPEGRDLRLDPASAQGRQGIENLVRRHTEGCLNKRVFVKADAGLPFKDVNDLFQLCRKGGAEEASIVTGESPNPGKEGGL